MHYTSKESYHREATTIGRMRNITVKVTGPALAVVSSPGVSVVRGNMIVADSSKGCAHHSNKKVEE